MSPLEEIHAVIERDRVVLLTDDDPGPLSVVLRNGECVIGREHMFPSGSSAERIGKMGSEVAQTPSFGSNEPQPQDEEFLTVAQIADWLQLNQQTIRNWIDEGALPAVRIGRRRVRVKRSDLERYIEAGRMDTPKSGEPDQAAEASEPVGVGTAEPSSTSAETSKAGEPERADRGEKANPAREDAVMVKARERIAAAVSASLAADSGHTPAELAGALRMLAAAAEELAADLESSPGAPAQHAEGDSGSSPQEARRTIKNTGGPMNAKG